MIWDLAGYRNVGALAMQLAPDSQGILVVCGYKHVVAR